MIPFDFEKTLVHELLHLKFSLLADKVEDMQSRYVHQMIDEMARSLVDAKRCGADGERRAAE
jgi:phage shock protein A